MRSSLLVIAVLAAMPLAAASDFHAEQYAGKVVYLDFWASWCTPCRQSFPWMRALQQRLGPAGLEVVTVNMDQDPALAARFLTEMSATFPVFYDSMGKIANRYQVIGMPTAIVLDRAGQVRFRHTGFFPKKEASYEEHLLSVLREPAR